jgi:hypothetical protein
MLLALFLVLLLDANGQSDTARQLTFSGYGDLYYSYDFSNPENHQKPDFVYNHKRHNEINANLLLARLNYQTSGTRASLGVMAGNYPEYNLANEPQWAQFIYEANVGFRISKKHNLWLDAGIMPSHIGFESAICQDNLTLTRSILADNSPYYETGIKFSYENEQKNLFLAFLILNGWQNISKADGQQRPSFGTQFTFIVNDHLSFNYSTFFGSAQPDSLQAFRTYHNLYSQFSIGERLSFIAGIDIGTDKYNGNDYFYWYSPVFICRYKTSDKTAIALRGEYYDDKKQIIIYTGTANGFQTAGVSLNYDCAISEKITFRTEWKTYLAGDKIFPENSSENHAVTTNLNFSF